MAQQNYKDFETILKTQYSSEKFQNYMVGNSPSFREVKTLQIAGKDYKFAGMTGRGAGVSGDYIVARAQAGNAKNVEWTVVNGRIFSVKNIEMPDYLASKTLTAAYVSSALEQCYAGLENVRKVMGICWTFGTGYGEFAKLPAAVAAGATTCSLQSFSVMAIGVDTAFRVTAGVTGLPNEAFIDNQVYTVTAVNDDNTITFTPGATAVTGWAAGAYLELDGGRDTNGAPNMPAGLEAWLPTAFERGTKADGTTDATRLGYWNTFKAVTFCGVNRSTDFKTLGTYVRKGTSEKIVAAVGRALKLAVRHGASETGLKVVYGDNTWEAVANEIGADAVLHQIIGDVKTPKVTKGYQDIQVYFDRAVLDNKIVDAYIPDERIYVLDMDTWRLIGMSNLMAIQNDGATNAMATPIEDISAFDPASAYRFDFSQYINVTPGVPTSMGPAVEVGFFIYANFLCLNPFHNSVVSLAA